MNVVKRGVFNKKRCNLFENSGELAGITDRNLFANKYISNSLM